MPTRTKNWPAGTPNWVDCSFNDIKVARKFYGRLFGWELGEDPAEDGYTMCLKNGHPVAALAPAMDDFPSGQWFAFFSTDDVDATRDIVVEAGGSVLVEPTDVEDAGRTACFRDPEGAIFGVWQGEAHTGFALYGEPGSVAWIDFMTRNFEAAQSFYAKVFGFSYEPMGDDYVTFTVPGGERPAGGIHLAKQLPDDVDASWFVHFAVANRDATIGIVEELGDDSEVLNSFEMPFGLEAIVQGVEGETFGITELFDPEGSTSVD